MKSMTGFGRGEYRDEEFEIIVEMKSINHRYKDFFIKTPRQIAMLEENIRKHVSESVSRGRVEISIKLNRGAIGDKSLSLNSKLAEEYVKSLKALKDSFLEITGEISLSLVSRFPDVITATENEVDLDILWQKVSPALECAISALVDSREREGDTLKKDFEMRLAYINENLSIAEKRAPKVSQDYRARLEDKVKEYTNCIEVDESRLLNEVAIFADRVSIDEEITRLKSHIQRFYTIIEETEPVGRKLDFLIQEMNREINTIGSKANDIEISNCVVDMKSELEKMREQVQNIE
ncbi:uncharacterized protein (TIGR00255 family) [Alkalibaculum bacchi]|uniref:Uncharacterized protein (TIGR00255 family) n=1 Tax=Alkalibaculum bacchi TaxID=645887 RepID=A0A366IDJ1_9FIRM|nr:YicC/YloC family endoribonuclease [Alkalibaculum bacchi]RBP68304.1 uncharacterized protein (TIGR00255 family) [Alkalibaculum bacchi]